MSAAVPGFDEWLSDALRRCADGRGEAVDAYVARAVGAQMLADSIHEDELVDQLRHHLRSAGVTVTGADGMPDVSAEILNPDRLRSLHATGLLDSPPEEIFDRVTRAASQALDVPFAAVSLVDSDRQFFKSAVGLSGDLAQKRQTPLEMSVCQYAVANRAPLVLEDARNDPTFQEHPAVLAGAVVAYLGIPLFDPSGNALGTLCVYDTKPRVWSAGHIQVLSDLAALATDRMFA